MKLWNYLPQYYGSIKEMMALLSGAGEGLEEAKDEVSRLPKENSIWNGSEKAVVRWERLLNIDPLGSLLQRKMYLLAVLRGQGDLDESRISDIVNSFTGAVKSATVDFVNSVVRVRVLPPEWGEIYLFQQIEEALKPRIPAHLGLLVERYYCTWQNVANHSQNWAGVMANFENWQDVKTDILTDEEDTNATNNQL